MRMNRRIPIWAALAGCAGSAALGAGLMVASEARAQAPDTEEKPGAAPAPLPSEYPYLPARYGEAYIPSVAEWQAMRLTSLGASTTRLTEQFNRQHVTCFTTPKGLLMTLDLAPLPTWKYSAPGGKFTAPVETVKPDVEKAVQQTMRFTRNFFSEVSDKDVSLRVFISSEFVGVWENGKLTLNVEKS